MQSTFVAKEQLQVTAIGQCPWARLRRGSVIVPKLAMDDFRCRFDVCKELFDCDYAMLALLLHKLWRKQPQVLPAISDKHGEQTLTNRE